MVGIRVLKTSYVCSILRNDEVYYLQKDYPHRTWRINSTLWLGHAYKCCRVNLTNAITALSRRHYSGIGPRYFGDALLEFSTN